MNQISIVGVNCQNFDRVCTILAKAGYAGSLTWEKETEATLDIGNAHERNLWLISTWEVRNMVISLLKTNGISIYKNSVQMTDCNFIISDSE